MKYADSQWLNRESLLLCLSAFFADLGYQGVTALYPLFIVFQLHQSPFIYGLITGLSFGIGSLLAFLGGWLGDRIPKKRIVIVGNLGILLLATSGLTSSIWASGILFMLGWWFRYLRTPPRRAMLVNVTPKEHHSKVFGFLHLLDIGGGLVSILLAISFLLIHIPVGRIISFSALPIFLSTMVLLPVRSNFCERSAPATDVDKSSKNLTELSTEAMWQRKIYIAILIAAGLYGFSFYNLGFPVLSSALSSNLKIDGVSTFGIYLGVSAISGWFLGKANLKGLNALWKYGFLTSAIASYLIAIFVFGRGFAWGINIAVAVLGFGMGAVETYEPSMIASLRTSENISSGMGGLSVARSLGQFGANLIMGALFVLGEGYAYIFAGTTALLAAILLLRTELQLRDRS